MKYSVIILNLTIMLGSVMLKRPSPFIFLKIGRDSRVKPKLPIDGWLNPFEATDDYTFKLLCEETPTAQIIKYRFQIYDTDSKILKLDSIEGDKVIIIIKNVEKTQTVVTGRKCDNESQMIFAKNINYGGLLLFKIVKSGVQINVTFTGTTIMNYLSYEDAVADAIDLFKNSLIKNEDSHRIQLKKARIYASLFRGLSSTLVEGYRYYFVTIKFMQLAKYKKNNHVKCEGRKDGYVTAAPFIRYLLFFNESNREQTLTVFHGKDHAFITANTIHL